MILLSKVLGEGIEYDCSLVTVASERVVRLKQYQTLGGSVVTIPLRLLPERSIEVSGNNLTLPERHGVPRGQVLIIG